MIALLAIVAVLAVAVLLKLLIVVFKAHFWAVIICLPGGLLLRFGGCEDMRILAASTALWTAVLLACLFSRRRARA